MYESLKSAEPLVAAAFITIALLTGCRIDRGGADSNVARADSGEVDFELAGPGGAALVIPVHINGQGPFHFVLDTGATFTCLSPELQEQLALPDRSEGIAFGAGIGGSGQIQLVRADSVSVGDTVSRAVTLCVIDLGQLEATGISVDGLLGLNFLQDYRLTLDFERNVATFE